MRVRVSIQVLLLVLASASLTEPSPQLLAGAFKMKQTFLIIFSKLNDD